MENSSKFTLLHRLLHWTMAFAMPVLFITGFLRMYWMNKHHISDVIASKTTALPPEVMSDIGATVREPMWQWHETFAHIMIIAFVVRKLYMVIEGVRFPNPFKAQQSISERLQGLTYLYFYIFVFVQAFTGVCMEKDLLSNFHEQLESTHKLAIYGFPIFVVLHLLGIVIAEHSSKKGISSKMIGGD